MGSRWKGISRCSIVCPWSSNERFCDQEANSAQRRFCISTSVLSPCDCNERCPKRTTAGDTRPQFCQRPVVPDATNRRQQSQQFTKYSKSQSTPRKSDKSSGDCRKSGCSSTATTAKRFRRCSCADIDSDFNVHKCGDFHCRSNPDSHSSSCSASGSCPSSCRQWISSCRHSSTTPWKSSRSSE